MVQKFQLKESVGKVIWHSLDEDGYVGEYDMQFGDVVLEGIDPEYVSPVVLQEHGHPMQKRDDD